ncbi:hypothetical protein JX265_012755 [Neoarthrinium moseri]|uniref:Thioesterase/thiol ester dehydrase-isomerase n=1 Tax=Neoarthrinium moseri TaxID=1658444 RepID=A0A9P9W9Q5_9PEZI|nr:uncharacterized protein JN550_008830 [Neoarthrinium moseri]KAI1849504.1 hypothetical protein JX266_004999 [Neoarthrinium moseri]KAI1853464.1 hypothetical protein JX265_012755 [Neoarthrinium moseri]KAI1864543.1 hypothetical protein JN550_008830 [Neoarthrinium moseri]
MACRARLKPRGAAFPWPVTALPRPGATPSYLGPHSCFHRRRLATSSAAPEAPPARWHADLKTRLGKCIIFGCTPPQVQRAAGVLRAVAQEWRTLTAGSEGFLTGGLRGLEDQAVVWGEMDSFQHVNNATYIRYAESARVNWITHFASVDPSHGSEWRKLMTPRATGLILKSIKADYKFHRRIAARTEEDIVIYDYKAASKTTMPPFVLGVFQDTWQRQVDEMARARQRIWQLVGEVESLEKETWNREDAVEDLGAAA